VVFSTVLRLGSVPKDPHWGAFYLGKKKEGNPFFDKATFYTMKEIEKMLKKVGFRIKKIRITLFQRLREKSVVEEPAMHTRKKQDSYACCHERTEVFIRTEMIVNWSFLA
jgi:hypothetical protein